MLNKDTIESLVSVPTHLETRTAIYNQPEVGLTHNHVHLMFLMDKWGYLADNFCG
jgi:hypothetical protein